MMPQVFASPEEAINKGVIGRKVQTITVVDRCVRIFMDNGVELEFNLGDQDTFEIHIPREDRVSA